MSNVFSNAIKIAQERQAWESKINPTGEMFVSKGLSQADLAQSQKQIDAFKAAIIEAAVQSDFKSAGQVKEALDAIDYEKEYLPLRTFAEVCLPVQKETMLLAAELAPARLATVNRIRSGQFAEYDVEAEPEGVLVHKAELGAEEPRSAKERQEARGAEQGKAFEDLSGKLGTAMKSAQPGQSILAAKSAMKKLGGLMMIDGVRTEIAPKGQLKLFDEASAPTPPKVVKPRAPRAKKAGK